MRLNNLNDVNEKRQQCPARDKDETDVRPAEDEPADQQYHIGIASRGNQTKLAVEPAPYMNVKAMRRDERAFDQPLQDIARK